MTIVSIIIINYNSSKYTIDCVKSIIKHTPENIFEIIIVDNQSNIEDYNNLLVLNDFPFIKLFRSRINVGFASGNMLGVQYADIKSKYYYFLNNDCELLNNSISILSDFLDKNPNIGIATAQMYTTEGNWVSSFGYFPSLSQLFFGNSFLTFLNRKKYPEINFQYQDPVMIQRATGSDLFVNAQYFNNIGGFDTNYFLFCEEEDICKRVNLEGWDIYLVPNAKFIHHSGKSTKRNLAIEKEFYISFFYFIKKFYHPITYWMIRIFYFVKLLKKTFKDSSNLKLAFFVLLNPIMKYSLRFKQKIQ